MTLLIVSLAIAWGQTCHPLSRLLPQLEVCVCQEGKSFSYVLKVSYGVEAVAEGAPLVKC